MITGEEMERRLRRISQMRELCIQLRYAALKEYQEGRIPFKPNIDIRSDYEYWRKKREEQEKEG